MLPGLYDVKLTVRYTSSSILVYYKLYPESSI